MTDRDDLERRLEAWLANTARAMPPELFDDIVATAPQRARTGVRSEFPSGGRWRLALGALAAVLVFVVGAGIAGRLRLAPATADSGAPSQFGPSAGGSLPPSSSPSPSPSPEPSVGETVGTSPSPGAVLPTASPIAEEWHRNNYNAGHERLVCSEASASWTCRYRVSDGTGWFTGQNVTDTWTCPGWFPSGTCDDVIAVYHGRLVLVAPEGQTPGPGSVITQDYVITDVDGRAVLQLYWVDQFVCPWYRTYKEALAAEFVCWFAP
jgi:hypothetical protein